MFRTDGLLLDGVRLTGLVALEPLDPRDDLVQRWREDHPLVRQLPELRSAEWIWGLAPQCTLLTGHGFVVRDFCWLARGRVHVVRRSDAGDPMPAAVLDGGAGIGESSLLEGRTRTADVIAAEDCVVAVLDEPAYRRPADETTDEQVRTVVEASQGPGGSSVSGGSRRTSGSGGSHTRSPAGFPRAPNSLPPASADAEKRPSVDHFGTPAG